MRECCACAFVSASFVCVCKVSHVCVSVCGWGGGGWVGALHKVFARSLDGFRREGHVLFPGIFFF